VTSGDTRVAGGIELLLPATLQLLRAATIGTRAGSSRELSPDQRRPFGA
jgi:hypothetical protein